MNISTVAATLGLAAILTAALPAGRAEALTLNPLSIVKGAVEAAVEDRSSDNIAKDTEINAKITADVIDKMGSDVISISVDVYEQDVMLTGIVEKNTQKSEAEKLTRGVEGVKKVYNEIMVVSKVDREKGAVEGFVDDTVIETKIEALLADASGVSHTNWRWRSNHGHVVLFGRALSSAERAKGIGVVNDIKGIRSVTVHVKVKPKAE